METETDVQSLDSLEKKWKDLSNRDSTGIPVDCSSLVQNQDLRWYKLRTRHRRGEVAARYTQKFVLTHFGYV